MKELLETGVSLGLEYVAEQDALIGKVKDYAVAVRENNQTSSYGVLIWVKKGDLTAITDAESYLDSQVKAKPDLVKHFMVTERGIAIALIKCGDAFRNAQNIKHFLFDLVSSLSINFYKGCCYDCGCTDDLGIYENEGVLLQACGKCGGKYKSVKKFTENSFPSFEYKAPEMPKQETKASENKSGSDIEEKEDSDKQALIEAMAEAMKSVKTNESEKAETIDDLLTEANGTETVEEERHNISSSSGGSNVDFSSFMFGSESESKAAAAPVKSKLFEEAEREFAEQKKAQAEEQRDEAFDALMFSASEKKEPEPVIKAVERKPQEQDETLNELMFDGKGESAFPEAKPLSKEEIEFDRKRQAELERQSTEAMNALMFAGTVTKDNRGEDILVEEEQREVFGSDPENDVTEIHDDSNDYEDIDVEEIESTVTQPTVTTGHKQLEAKETPLEADGSVPLINPNSDYADAKPSPVNSPDAVVPLETRDILGSTGMMAVASGADYSNGAKGEEEEKNSASNVPEQKMGYAAGMDYSNQMNKTGDRRLKSPDIPPEAVKNSPYPLPVRVEKIEFGSNLLFGIIGALILGTLGLIVWVVLTKIGAGIAAGSSLRSASRTATYLTALGSFAIIIGAFLGYKLGGDEVDKKGIVASSIISILYNIIGMFINLVTSVQSSIEAAFGFQLSFNESVEWAIYGLMESGNRSLYLLRFGLSLAAMVVSLVVVVKHYAKNL